MDVPVALAIGIAYLASCIGFFTGGEVWFDTVVMFIFFLLLGRYVEMSARHRNQQSGSVLARLLPEWTRRLRDGQTETVLASELQPGDHVRVPPGEAFPADGVILQGETEVNEALLTGESFPLGKVPGSPVIAGSVNLLQPVDVRVAATGLDSTVSALGRLLERARARRSSMALLAERVAGRFVVTVLALAGIIAAWWLTRAPDQALPVTLAVLVVSCPCALSLAVPSAVAAASRALLRRGIILTRGDAIERLAGIDTILFDKTGTLTLDTLRIREIQINPARPEITEEFVLSLAASLESASAHPLATAFRGEAPLRAMDGVEVFPGQGVRGQFGGATYRIGSPHFALGPAAPPGEDRGAVWLSDELGWLAEFVLSDGLREGAGDAVRYCREQNLRTVILSGDTRARVAAAADALGVNEWKAGLTPAGKLEALAHLESEGSRVLMVGDGVNDAPVLAAADVSIAVQGGSELANSAADLILTGRSLALVCEARDLACATRRVIKQNMVWALLYNATMIPLAASSVLQPWMAAVGMSASSLLVVLNAARISWGDNPRTADAVTRWVEQPA
jgi:Cu2+-exporting ATPase